MSHKHTIATEITGTTVKLITTFDAAQCEYIILFGSDTLLLPKYIME